jgi:hypothetical protein
MLCQAFFYLMEISAFAVLINKAGGALIRQKNFIYSLWAADHGEDENIDFLYLSVWQICRSVSVPA